MDKRKVLRSTKETGLCFIVDKLTRCIQNVADGLEYDTVVLRLKIDDTKKLSKKEWTFDWKAESLESERMIYKLVLKAEEGTIQGLMCLEDKKDHIFMHLLESAKINKGRQKKYCGVAGNLVAFACKLSIEKGYEGFVAFDAKTKLIEHYEKTLGAKHQYGTRMFISTTPALNLVEHYFLKREG